MDEEIYHLGQNGQNTGPFTLAQVQDLWRSSAVSAGTLYWQPGMPEWQPLGQIVSKLGEPPSLPGSPPPVPAQGVDYLTRTVPAGLPATSGVAIASFVLGLASILLSLLTALPAIICGHIALSQIKQSHGRLGGRGFAVTGLVFGYLFVGLIAAIFVIGIGAGIALPIFTSVSTRGKATLELARAKQVALAIKLYEGDNDGKTPPSLDALSPTYLPDKSVLVSRLSEGESPAVELLIPDTKADDADPHAVLLRGKFTTPDHKRVYIYNDLQGELKRDP